MASIRSLLEETPEAAYWLGLLFSDGSVSDKRIYLKLNVRDKRLVEQFGRFIGARPLRVECGGTIASVTKQSPADVSKLRARFALERAKTYNPPWHLPYEDVGLLRCFLVGFIDGDGAICKQSGGRRHAFVRIKLHGSWHPFLELLAQVIGAPHSMATTSDGYSELRLCDNVWLAGLKRDTAGLPRLGRKWRKVNVNYHPVKDFARCDLARQLIRSGASSKAIKTATGMSYSQINATRRATGPCAQKAV